MVAAWVRGRQIKRGCGKCRDNPDLRRQWGCDGGEPRILFRGCGDIEIDRCHLRYVDEWTVQVFRLYDLFERGIMPVWGGALDQPADLLDAFEIVRDAVATARECP